MEELSVPVIALVGVGALVVLALALVFATLRRQRRAAELAATQRASEVETLRAQVARLERTMAAPVPSDREYVITHLGDVEAAPERTERTEPVKTVAAPVFADIVLRETVVQAASLAAGVRRALRAETRNRIRFEMKREIKRARKQRRSDLKVARREWEARQRSADADEEAAA